MLYIDDLDRCSPKQVVEVLQAVHLLLALDLFVVVVGVDPRWLLHSLKQQYREVLSSQDATSTRAGSTDPGAAVWHSTPLDYLEKIFNIPFMLPVMDATGFANLIRRLSVTSPASDPQDHHDQDPRHDERAGIGDDVRQIPDPAGPDVLGSPPTGLDRPRSEPELIGVQPPVVEAGSEIDSVRSGSNSQPRPLTEPELRLLSALAPLVRSPRGAKRMLNLYRILRSTQNVSDTSRFLGVEGRQGEYEAMGMLLGILTASPHRLRELLTAPAQDGVLGGICHRGPGPQGWADVVTGLWPRPDGTIWRNDVSADLSATDRQEWTDLLTRCEPACALVTLTNLEAFRRWGAQIIRFSFVLGQDTLATTPRPLDPP